MILSTAVPLKTLEPQINHDARVVMLGSCFTENVGAKLQYYGFQTTINPFGIIFNPVSLAHLITRSLNPPSFNNDDAAGSFSYLAHSNLNGASNLQVVKNLNSAACLLHKCIINASHIFITLGTAWVYEVKSTCQIVANCHKQPQKLFNKRLLSFNEIKQALDEMINEIKKVNNQTRIIFTLSPVRHLKDGFIDNQRSKSRLHECIQQQVEQDNAVYFPAYEIVMDELRDYRYYARDMMHLNDLGIDYVWERFRESVIQTSTQPAMNAVHKYQQLKNHRPRDVEKHQIHMQKLLKDLLKTYPNIVLYEK